MNVIEGRITGIAPMGSYDGQYGTVYTSGLTVQAESGSYAGEIGEKSPDTQYRIGQNIAVEVSGVPPNVRFKKFNPKYAAQQDDRQASRGSQQAPQRPAQGQKPEESVGRDARAERREIVYAYLQGGIEPDIGRVIYWMDFITTGNAPLPPAKEIRPQALYGTRD